MMNRADESLRRRLEEEHRRLIAQLDILLATQTDELDLSARETTSADIKTLMRFPQIVVRGDPGSGKSTLTRYITWATATDQRELIGEEPAARLPLCIRAIEFGEALENGRVDSLDEYLIDESGRFAPLVKHALATGNALVLVDGLDEVGKPALRARVKERVDDLIADPAFADNQIVVTTRIVGYERSGLTGRFPHFTLAELNDEQIADFVENWYGAIHDEMPAAIDVETEHQQLLKAIMGNDSIHRMSRNPLLLTIIALIKWQGRALPEQRVLLYDAAAQTLIRSWPLTQRRVELDELFIREWLAPVALHIFADGTSDLIDEYSLMEEVVASMRRLKSMTEIEARQASQELLEDVSLHSGIILPRGTDPDGRNLYGFLHQTFAEYLTAYHLAGRWEDGELSLIEYVHDPYWREVLLLMAGHLGTQRRAKAGRFIEAISNLRSSPYEDVIHRDLLLAGRILGDGVPAGPGDLIESLLRELLKLWQETPIHLLRADVEDVFGDLRGTEYAAVLARLARDSELNEFQTLALARQLGPDHFLDTLIELLDAKEARVRLEATRLLADREEPRAVDTLVELLDAEDPRIRFEAARLLTELDDPRGVDAQIELFISEDPRVSSKVLLLLSSQPVSRGYLETSAVLSELLTAKDRRIRAASARLLARPDDPQGLNALVELLDAEETKARFEAARLLARRDDPRAIDTLMELLDAEEARVRLEAARLLARRDDPRAIDTLMELLDAEEARVRLEAARLLAERDDPRAIDTLVELLHAEDSKLRLKATRLLAERDDPRAIDTLIELLHAEDPKLRLEAAQLLAKRDDLRAIDTLVELLDAEETRVRFEAARLLAEQDDPRGVDTQIELLISEDPRVSSEALLLLSRQLLSQGDLETSAVFMQLLTAKDLRIHAALARLLARTDDPQGLNALVELLDAEETKTRFEAARFLARRDDPQAIDTLIEFLEAEDPELRFEAAQLLAKREETRAFEAVRERLEMMLKDVAKPQAMVYPPYDGRSIADIAYRFLKQHLTPSGQLELSIQERVWISLLSKQRVK
jgi:HEAT repeat protein